MQTGYLKCFGLLEPAFDLAPDPRFFYTNRAYQEAFLALRFGIKLRNGVIVLTGEAGVGKTTLIRMVQDRCEASTHLLEISSADQHSSALIPRLMRALGLLGTASERYALVRELKRYLVQQLDQDRTFAVVLEDAHKFDLERFKEVESLSKLQWDNKNLLQIVLVGHPELKTKLQDPLLEPFKQRVALWCRLEPLPRAEVFTYIHHRLARAGQPNGGLFHPGAIDRIAVYSKGIPRLINAICDRALRSAHSNKSDQVSAEIVERLWEALQSPGAIESQMSPRLSTLAGHSQRIENHAESAVGASKFYKPAQSEHFALEERMSGSGRKRERGLHKSFLRLASFCKGSQKTAFSWLSVLTRARDCKQITARLATLGERARQSIVSRIAMFRDHGPTWSNSRSLGWSAVIGALLVGGSIPLLLSGQDRDPEPYARGVMREETEIWQGAKLAERPETPPSDSRFAEVPETPRLPEMRQQLSSELAVLEQGALARELGREPAKSENSSKRTASLPENAKTLNDKSLPVIYVHTSKQSDRPVIEEIGKVLRVDGYNVRNTRFTHNGTRGDVRFFFARDRRDAERIKSLVQSELGKRGYSLSLQLLERDGKKFENAAPGKIEVWLPPLANAQRNRRG